MVNPLKHVDIIDLVTINIYRGPSVPGDVNPLTVDISPIDPTKRLIWDTDAIKTLNTKLTEKIAGTELNHPNTVQYITQFAGSMLSELYRNGLVLFEDLPDSPDDPYAEAKRQYRSNR
jgi:hypothetical protein